MIRFLDRWYRKIFNLKPHPYDRIILYHVVKTPEEHRRIQDIIHGYNKKKYKTKNELKYTKEEIEVYGIERLEFLENKSKKYSGYYRNRKGGNPNIK